MKKMLIFVLLAGILLGVAGAVWLFFFRRGGDSPRDGRVVDWIQNSSAHADWRISALTRCGEAPFLLPTDGYIGYLWDDTFSASRRHQGIDIFGGSEPGKTPVYAAYDGYLTRFADWKSTVIIRIPSDPLNPGRQIWTYYTHMADSAGNPLISSTFPAGISDVPVKAGTFLGYQGNYSGTAGSPVGVHLHFSIVRDDASGEFLNELEISNTLDPSPYLGIQLNASQNPPEIPLCP
jgi:murein DD-endopeptidase MepM/ murein hydrolase activator NlpD